MGKKVWKRPMTPLILAVLFTLGVLFVLRYHVVRYSGDETVLLVFPKDGLSFSNTFHDLGEWKVADWWKHRDIAAKMGEALVGVLKLRLAGEVYETSDRELAVGQLKEEGFYCSWSDTRLLCLKI